MLCDYFVHLRETMQLTAFQHGEPYSIYFYLNH